jgi:hypothetical protein
MLKNLFKKNKKRSDIRFLDAESYKQGINFSEFSHSFDDFIQVEKENSTFTCNKFENIEPSSFLEIIRQATVYPEIHEEEQKLQAPDSLINPRPIDKCYLNSLGVFSDSKIYSALIHSILSTHDLDIKHFNHPVTFRKSQYSFFDTISSWIIFLSDEHDSDFLDCFLDRYVDKPTLFLFSKINKEACVSRIEQFIEQNNLAALESDQDIHLEDSLLPNC